MSGSFVTALDLPLARFRRSATCSFPLDGMFDACEFPVNGGVEFARGRCENPSARVLKDQLLFQRTVADHVEQGAEH